MRVVKGLTIDGSSRGPPTNSSDRQLALKKSGDARVIAYSSIRHNVAGVDFSDPNSLKRPMTGVAYVQSKIARSLFMVEFDKRAKPHGVRALAVHPGAILTDLLRYVSDEQLAV